MIISIIIIVVVAGVAYYAGNKHGKNIAQISQQSMRSQGQNSGRGRFGSGAGFISGDVLNKDATSITIKMRDGSSRIVLYTPSTQVMKSTSGLIDDVTIGSMISIQGAQNPDGSLTAQSVQIRPTTTPPVK